MVHAGKLVGLLECEIFDEQRRLVARASSTCMTLAGACAEGRALPAELTRGQGEARNSVEQNPAHNAEHLMLDNQLANIR